MSNLLEHIKSFFSAPSYSRTLALIGLLIVVIALPITVVVLQQHTNIFQHASGGTCASFSGVCRDYSKYPNATCPSNYTHNPSLDGTCTGISDYFCCTPNPAPGAPASCNPSISQSVGADCSCGPINSSQCNNEPAGGNHVLYNFYIDGCGNRHNVSSIASSPQCGYNPTTPPPACVDQPSTYTICSGTTLTVWTHHTCGQPDTAGISTPNSSQCNPSPTPIQCRNGYTQGSVSYRCTNYQNGATDPRGPHETCGTNFLTVATDCSTLGGTFTGPYGSLCCPVNAIVTPTPAPASSCPATIDLGQVVRAAGNLCNATVIAAHAPSCPYPSDYTSSQQQVSSGELDITCHYIGPAPTTSRAPSPIASPSSTTPGATLCSQNNGSCVTTGSNLSSSCQYVDGNGEISSPNNASCPSGYLCCKNGTIGGYANVTPATSPNPGNSGNPQNPEANSSPTPSCTNGQSTSFALALKLEGIGSGTFENNNPLHPTRIAAYVRVTDESGDKPPYDQSNVQFTYANGVFTAPAVNLGNTQATCGHTYTVTVKLPQYVKASGPVTYGNTTQTITLNPIPGDLVPSNTTMVQLTSDNKIIGDDNINPSDYNIFRECHTDPTSTFTATVGTSTITIHCTDLINLFDYQDGGIGTDVNGVSEFADNYNLWLRGYFKANGY